MCIFDIFTLLFSREAIIMYIHNTKWYISRWLICVTVDMIDIWNLCSIAIRTRREMSAFFMLSCGVLWFVLHRLTYCSRKVLHLAMLYLLPFGRTTLNFSFQCQRKQRGLKKIKRPWCQSPAFASWVNFGMLFDFSAVVSPSVQWR